MEAAHFAVRLFRGDYPWDGDAIAIPIFGYWVFGFLPSLLLLFAGLRPYNSDVRLFSWNACRFWRSLGWSILSVYPIGLLDLNLIFDGVLGRLYWDSAFFVLHLYCILILRASAVSSPIDVVSLEAETSKF
jgi:hypothetical protein